MDAVCDGSLDGFRDEAGLGIGPREEVFLMRMWGVCGVDVRKCVNRRSWGGVCGRPRHQMGVHVVQRERKVLGGFRFSLLDLPYGLRRRNVFDSFVKF